MESEPFDLEVGRLIRLPKDKLKTRPSRNAADHPDTPVVYRLLPAAERRGGFYFQRDYVGDQWERTFKLFAPDGLQAGDVVCVEWRDQTCACVRRATDQEALLTTASGSAHPEQI